MKRTLLTACLLMLATQLAYAADTGTTIKADSLRAEPYQDAKTLTTLNKGSPVSILKTQGGWLQIQSGKSKGWMRMLSVRRDAARSKVTSASSLSKLAAGRSGTGKIVATTGIRGLNEEELKAAHYDEAQVAQVESYASSKSTAQQFALKGKLVAQRVDYLSANGGAK